MLSISKPRNPSPLLLTQPNSLFPSNPIESTNYKASSQTEQYTVARQRIINVFTANRRGLHGVNRQTRTTVPSIIFLSSSSFPSTYSTLSIVPAPIPAANSSLWPQDRATQHSKDDGLILPLNLAFNLLKLQESLGICFCSGQISIWKFKFWPFFFSPILPSYVSPQVCPISSYKYLLSYSFRVGDPSLREGLGIQNRERE